jgi:hypothetical protein
MACASAQKLKTICAKIVGEYIDYALNSGFMHPDETDKSKKILQKSARHAFYNKKFPDSAGGGAHAVWFGENFRATIDGAKSLNDPIFYDGDFCVQKVLFHEYTHVLQTANAKRNGGAYFAEYKQSVKRTTRRGYFCAFDEIAASLVVKNDFYAPETKLGGDFLAKINMTPTDFIRATTFEPEIFNQMGARYKTTGGNFGEFLKTLDDALLKKHLM